MKVTKEQKFTIFEILTELRDSTKKLETLGEEVKSNEVANLVCEANVKIGDAIIALEKVYKP